MSEREEEGKVLRRAPLRSEVGQFHEDKFGVFWQIVPTVMLEWLSGKDTAKAGRVMEAMLQMTKLDINKLKEAAR